MTLTLPPLYAILDVDRLAARGLQPTPVCRAWLSAGVRLIQLRAKTLPSGALLELVDHCALLCREAGAMFVVNDRADLAAMGRADGVHVGQDDLSPADVRRAVGPAAVVGVSTHDHAQVEAACLEPVSYLALGPVFGTSTKNTGYAALGLDQVRRAAATAHHAGLPLVAIGGITLEHSASVLEAGADSVAVISGLLPPGDQADLSICARQWVRRTAG